MAEILGKKKSVNVKQNAIRICCTSRQVSGKSCVDCPFLNKGCARPARIYSVGLLMPTVNLKPNPN